MIRFSHYLEGKSEMPNRDRHEWDGHWIVANLLDEARDFLLDLFKPTLAVWRLSGVHLVDGDDTLLDNQCIGDTSFELSSSGGDNQ